MFTPLLALLFVVQPAALLTDRASYEAFLSEPFAEQIVNFAYEDAVYPPQPCGTLFIGSSSIRYWFRLAEEFPDRRIIRRGFGGSQIEHSTYYFDLIVAPHEPREIVLYAGENDLNAGKAPEQVFADFKAFMAKKSARLAATPVYYVSIKPSPLRANMLEAQTATNALIAAYAAERKDLHFIDVASGMLENGTPKDIFIHDRLHMNYKGYEIWQDQIAAAFAAADLPPVPACR